MTLTDPSPFGTDAHARRNVTHVFLAIVMLCLMAPSVPGGQAVAAPDFSAVVILEPEVAGPGKVAGLARNIGNWTIRNIHLRVRHRWSWSGGGRYEHSDNAVISRLVLPGEAAGFAAVHLPPERVPAQAAYAMDVTVMELTEIRIAAQ